MKSKKNAFTLIELLAIIVILAIIAVITVPIILNIIENSRKGAATDSAYGYKDSINKYYVSELSGNHELTLSGEYTVTNGVLNGSGIVNKEIPVSGDKPSAGELHYSNNELKGGCLVIGDYAIIFDGGNVASTEKGNCDDYDFPGEDANTVAVDPYSMTEMCPGCVFTRDFSWQSTNQVLTAETVNSYSGYNDGDAFLGFIVEDGVMTKAFVCGIENNEAFCFDGSDPSAKYNYNLDILHHFFGNNNDWQVYPDSAVGVSVSGAAVSSVQNTITGSDNNCFVANSGGAGLADC